MTEFLIQMNETFVCDYLVDVQVGDVFTTPMKGWEKHVKAILDSRNVLVWHESDSKEQHLPLAERVENISVYKVQSLFDECGGFTRGGAYTYKKHDRDSRGTWLTVGGEWVGHGIPHGVAHRNFNQEYRGPYPYRDQGKPKGDCCPYCQQPWPKEDPP